MSNSSQHSVLLQPPTPGLPMDVKDQYKFNYEVWKRTGGYNSSLTNLQGLEVSAVQLNTLIDIRTDDTVQQQLSQKANTASLGSMAYQNQNSVIITGGNISSVNISRSNITVQPGTSNNDIPIGGTLVSNTTSVGNVGVGEDTLITHLVLAASLVTTGSYLEISAWGTVAANANNKTIKLKFGTTTLVDTTAVAANSGSWYITAKIVRVTATSQQCIASIISDNALITNSATYTDAIENLDSNLNVFCTGEATTDDDIIQKGLLIKWFKA